MKKLIIIAIVVALFYYGCLNLKVKVDPNTNTADLDLFTGNTDYVQDTVNDLKDDYIICKNLCGDGTCQEVVCQAVGCPCAETKATCPADCK